jgi:hypothetical protein
MPKTLMLLLAASSLSAQEVVTREDLKLHRLPANGSKVLRVLAVGETLSLRQTAPIKGFFAVQTRQGEDGFVGAKHVNPVSAPNGGPTIGGNVIANAGGGAFKQIDSTWSKPPIDTLSILVQGGALSCGPNGDGGDTETNHRKNREDVPQQSHLVTVDAIRALNDTALWRHGDSSRTVWTPGDRALVTPYEGIALTVEGFFNIVKPQKTAPPKPRKKVGETTNCHSWEEADTDWHVSLVASPNETEEEGVVVEPTPRTKRMNPGWVASAMQALAVRQSAHATPHPEKAKQIRVTGFLMLDPAHTNHIRGGCASLPTCKDTTFFRATLWELHPVTRIEVKTDTGWANLGKPPSP